MHELLPQIIGQQAMIAAMDRGAFDRVSNLVAGVLQADARVGQAGLQFTPSDPDSAKALAACYDDTLLLERAIPREVAEIISHSARPSQASPNKSLQPTGPA
jgi:hypothetical protein